MGAKLAEIKPIQNPETEQFCAEVAHRYMCGEDPDALLNVVNSWVAARSLVRWEVLALRERINYLVKAGA